MYRSAHNRCFCRMHPVTASFAGTIVRAASINRVGIMASWHHGINAHMHCDCNRVSVYSLLPNPQSMSHRVPPGLI